MHSSINCSSSSFNHATIFRTRMRPRACRFPRRRRGGNRLNSLTKMFKDRKYIARLRKSKMGGKEETMPAMLHLSEGSCAAELLRVIEEARFECLKHLTKKRKWWGRGISVRKQIGQEDLRRQRCGEGCRSRGMRTCLACSACFWAWRTCTEGHDTTAAMPPATAVTCAALIAFTLASSCFATFALERATPSATTAAL
jgi:hypothetical protein